MSAKSLYDFTIDPERIAQRPRAFGSQKLLVYHKQRDEIEHTTFELLPQLLQPGDLLVLNDTQVVPAQVRLVEPIVGDCTSFLFLDPLCAVTSTMEVLLNTRVDVGSVLSLPGGLTFRVDELVGGDPEVHRGNLFGLSGPLHEYLAGIGEMPLPPYVARVPDKEDEKAYQTSVAQVPGAIAAPTAGLHFYPALLDRLHDAGIHHVCVTLHVGYGTFRSFSTEFVEHHQMDRERYHVSVAAGAAIHQALQEKRRVIAVGTTATRVLETCADSFRAPTPPADLSGEAGIFIYPPYEFKVLSGLFTNFHYPKTSVLTLTAAMVGSRDLLIDRIYKEALDRDYLWYSYGDGMLVL
ncbi:S-adenosylmethionine:tRNA ribosyltransferase-isomerase [Aphanomyces astaci]|uniref:S-adenosylmethionine:tRNA ribosyltransferase-isomerase n=1 Tax=Aphanomyces astaci TaxID=112090 RepID=W4FTE1_APHAT|nr:S-adenosylmethionine:tRNA ribosyltransferase-isomerase [Aphanomyces astaci]ETV69928.1 S-adenosylmethionine:tRNA ribosyltransferase-isomerase [Aphanomyces astaci]|eukprot:XP_009840666.1 S-adenosylmethionine:tRNA ribosyltransferase-isomerase [Aphanomyces astaci]